ncbi:MAG: hypothetical protein WAL71_05640 [Terriglobales bacterium]
MKTVRSGLSLLACLTLAALYNPIVSAQQNPGASGAPAHMVVTVEPHHGSEPTVDVTRADVMVYEGKERDQVTEWIPAQGDHAGLEFFILIDDSSSSSLALQFGDIKNFISAQPATTKIGIVYMQNGTARIEQNLTTDHDLAEKALRLPLGAGTSGSSPYFSLRDLIKHWPQDGTRHEVLMVTNGSDPYYGSRDTQDPYLSAAIEDSQRAGVIVSAIYAPGTGHFGHSYWLSYWGQLYLAKLTEETGGEGYSLGFMGLAPNFAPFLTDAANRLKHQYLLTFLAKPEKKAGMRSVKVKTELPNVDLVAADEVYVPASE